MQIAKNDTDRLMPNVRFLQERFANSALQLDPAKAGSRLGELLATIGRTALGSSDANGRNYASVTPTQRVLRFLASRKNIGGCILAAGAAALFVFGIPGGLIGLAAIPALYALGYFLVRPEQGVKLTFFDERNSQQIRQGLNDITYSLRFRVADDVMAAVEDLCRSILLTLPPPGAPGMAAIDPTVMLIRQTALHYLPKSLDEYLAIPRMYAERVPIQDDKTARDVLIEQLKMMSQKMQETAQAMYRYDADRLLSNARFLQERFATSAFDKVPVVDLVGVRLRPTPGSRDDRPRSQSGQP